MDKATDEFLRGLGYIPMEEVIEEKCGGVQNVKKVWKDLVNNGFVAEVPMAPSTKYPSQHF